MAKRVGLTAKPASRPVVTADEWVSAVTDTEKVVPVLQPIEKVPMTRLTIDIPSDLHTRIKTQCASKNVKMVEEIRIVLERHFAVE